MSPTSAISSGPFQTAQLAPISHLPNEILIAIFKHGVNALPESADSPSFHELTSSVCRVWRDVILQSPELWTRIFITASTHLGHLQTCAERSASLQIDIFICHIVSDSPACPNCLEKILNAVLDVARRHSHRLRSLALWNVPDFVPCTIWKGLRSIHAPVLTDILVRTYTFPSAFVFGHPPLSLLPFVDGYAPKLANLEISFPFVVFALDVKRFDFAALTSLTLRAEECPLMGYNLPCYLVEFPTLCALLRTTPNLAYLALYGPVIEPDEDFPNRPPPVDLPALKTLLIHRREPGVRYHCEFLSVLTAPNLTHVELPWHDKTYVEPSREDRTGYLFDAEGTPRFPLVQRLYLHDSAVKWKFPTASFIKAFPRAEDVTLGGTDIEHFSAALSRSVVAKPHPAHGTLARGAWHSIRKLTLKRVNMGSWKRCVATLSRWLEARGYEGPRLIVEVLSEIPPHRHGAFMRSLHRLRPYAQVTYRNVDV